MSLRRVAALVALAGCNGFEHPAVQPTARTGTVIVKVTDHGGAVIGGAQLALESLRAQTGADGTAVFDAIAEGVYLLSADAPGWQPETVAVKASFARTTAANMSLSLRHADVSDVHLLFAGDLSFDNGINDPNRDGVTTDSVVPAGPGAAQGAANLLSRIAPLLGRFDLVTANLATVLGNGATPHPAKPTRAVAPPEIAQAFIPSRIDVLNLGNDHAYDYLDTGVRGTLFALDAVGVARFGAGRDLAEASTPALVSRLGLVVGQVGESALLGHGATPKQEAPPYYDAAVDKAGVAPATRADIAAAVAQTKLGADVVVAHLAAGQEWDTSGEPLRPLAEAAAEAGAALVVGHGPRPLLPILKVGSTIAAAGLGQMVFGGLRPEGRTGFLLEALVRYRRVQGFRIWPTALVHYAPQLASDDLAARIVRRLGTLSRAELLVYPLDGRGEVAVTPDAARTHEDSLSARLPVAAAPDGGGRTDVFRLIDGSYENFVVSVDAKTAAGPEQALSIELGRELLWDGGFEDHTAGGAGIGLGAGWRYLGPDVGPSDRDVHSGRLALELVRKSGNSGSASLRHAGLLSLHAGQRYTFSGCTKTDGEVSATAALGIYPSRALGAKPIATAAVAPIGAHAGWTCFSVEYQPVIETLAEPTVTLDRPAGGTARLLVDDLSLVEWDPPLAAASLVPAPNEYEFARCLAPQPTGEIALHWVTRRYQPLPDAGP